MSNSVRLLIFFLLLVTNAHAQEAASPKCSLQQLAIDAALGDIDAQFNLGVAFYRGEDVSRDYGKAAKMWRIALDAGRVVAANNLGYLKYYGLPGVEQDYSEGIRLWRFAAVRGIAESQVHMGEVYSDGKFLKPDFIEAYAWAKAGKHYAAKMTEQELGAKIENSADEVLAGIRQKLTVKQLAIAEKKATEYIGRYAPR